MQDFTGFVLKRSIASTGKRQHWTQALRLFQIEFSVLNLLHILLQFPIAVREQEVGGWRIVESLKWTPKT